MKKKNEETKKNEHSKEGNEEKSRQKGGNQGQQEIGDKATCPKKTSLIVPMVKHLIPKRRNGQAAVSST